MASSKNDADDDSKDPKDGPSRLACLQCRQKHLKCDGKQPVCNRCSTADIQCLYTASRRGYRGPSKRKMPNEIVMDTFSMTNGEDYNAGTSAASQQPTPTSTMFAPSSGYSSYPVNTQSDASIMDADPFLMAQLLQGYHHSPAFSVPMPAPIPSPSLSGIDEKLVYLYYDNFHKAHPILPPWHILRAHQPPKHLLNVIQFVGGHFTTTYSRSVLRNMLTTELDKAPERSVALVQTRLLAAIAFHARNEQKEAIAILHRAIDLALEIGLNNEGAAIVHGRQIAILEESIRRTWWELFVVDGILAGLHQEKGFRTFGVQLGICLPCEDAAFVSDQYIPPPPTLEQFQNRFFEVDDLSSFSSYCYRIEAVRLLGRVLTISTCPNKAKDEAEAANCALIGWFHHLPSTKMEILDSHGGIDEMLFQAHMIVNCAIVYLNLPRSNLAAAQPANAEIECARRVSVSTPSSSCHVHAVNATKAAKELSSLASLPVHVHRHTPFFICSCVLSTVVQLSACCVNSCKCLEPHRQQIIQSIGMLKTLGQVWPVAYHVLKQVRSVTNEVNKTGFKPPSPETPPEDIVDRDRLIQETMWDPAHFAFDLGQHTFSEG